MKPTDTEADNTRLVAAREKAVYAGCCQDVTVPTGSDQRMIEGFRAGRESPKRGQRRQLHVESVNCKNIVVHLRGVLRRRARTIVAEITEISGDLGPISAASDTCVFRELGRCERCCTWPSA